ncbi:hypothetical protein LIER_04512 [Lithospermum erythrorhizon]|uniref:Uncharacterized protein n=1 Tax=Lithospermum erythrorhizon TaxID=34254 RepID=A0AAV3NZR1_LITER
MPSKIEEEPTSEKKNAKSKPPMNNAIVEVGTSNTESIIDSPKYYPTISQDLSFIDSGTINFLASRFSSHQPTLWKQELFLICLGWKEIHLNL